MDPKSPRSRPDDAATRSTRRRFLALTTTATAGVTLSGCLGMTTESSNGSGGSDSSNDSSGSIGSNASDGGDLETAADVDEWMADALNYDGVVDETGTDEVTVTVGADAASGPYAYDPAAVRVSRGTTVVWKWVAASGAHNVVDEGGAFESELYSRGNATFEYTADEPGTYLYFCTPHRGLGMKGALVVEES
ncbi:halocyanin domain-containing protein [Haloprofundus salilacus]|uniref:halocyanin domain-containing protein n=1 Tax=Haloprofundus salilacus TaxID=2876190 RepID=UPI001CCDCA57|nr:halocyanin domain-containing protein [Haloprofundus salilacus]